VQNVDITAVNLADNTRVQVYNVTKASELDNSVVSGGSGYSLTVNLGGASVDINDSIRLRATYTSGVTAFLPIESTSLLSSIGIAFSDTQEIDTVYDSYGIDGSTITKFTADYVDDEIDLVVASNFTGQEMYSWWAYNLTTSQGISDFYGGLVAIDEANLRINSNIVNVFFDNDTTSNVYQTDNRRIFRVDEVYPVKDPTTGGGGIDIVWKNTILVVQTGVSGLTASESSKLLSLGTPSETADAVWDEAVSSHTTTGTTGEKLSKTLEKNFYLGTK
jgi:hypothetical protein